jgi:hypothetical protein
MMPAAKWKEITGRYAEKRITKRVGGSAAAFVHTIAGPLEAEIVDVSLTGARIRTFRGALLPVVSVISIADYGIELKATRVWVKGAMSGWRFQFDNRQSKKFQQALMDAFFN